MVPQLSVLCVNQVSLGGNDRDSMGVRKSSCVQKRRVARRSLQDIHLSNRRTLRTSLGCYPALHCETGIGNIILDDPTARSTLAYNGVSMVSLVIPGVDRVPPCPFGDCPYVPSISVGSIAKDPSAVFPHFFCQILRDTGSMRVTKLTKFTCLARRTGDSHSGRSHSFVTWMICLT